MERYIKLMSETTKDISLVLRDIIKKRERDIDDFDALDLKYVSRSGRIPTASNDVQVTDVFGQTSYDPTTGYLYMFGNNAGTPQWRRVQLNVF